MPQPRRPSRSAGKWRTLTGCTHVQVFKYSLLGTTGKPTIDILPWDVFSIAKKQQKYVLLWGLFLCLTSPFIIIQPLSEYALSPNKTVLLQRAKLRSQAGVVDPRFFTCLTSFHYRSNRDGFEGVHPQACTKPTPLAGSGNPRGTDGLRGAWATPSRRQPRGPARGAGSRRAKKVFRSAGRPHPWQKPAGASLESPALLFCRIKTLIRCWHRTKTPSEML